MIDEHNDNIVLFTLIVGRKHTNDFIAAILEAGGRLVNTAYGRGSVKAGYLRDMLGFVPEENKVLLTCLLPSAKADIMIDILYEKFEFDKPNTGIAFTMPIDKLVF